LYLKQREAVPRVRRYLQQHQKLSFIQTPEMGVYYCAQNGNSLLATLITIFNSLVNVTARFQGTNSFDISWQPADIYLYQVSENGEVFTGKLIKR